MAFQAARDGSSIGASLLSQPALAGLLAELPPAGLLASALESAPGVRFPLSFAKLEEEVNFLGLLSLLRFGSGWEREARAAAPARGDGVADRLLRGLFQLSIAGNRLDADALQNLSEFAVGSAWSLHLQEDKPHPSSPAFSVATDTPARPFVALLTHAMNETGRKLWERQHATLGAFVLAALQRESRAEALVTALASAFPAFSDPPFHAKALALAVDLRRRFGEEQPPLFALADLDGAPVAADARLVLALVRRGALDVPAGCTAAQLRAAALLAVDVLAQEGRSAAAVSLWLTANSEGEEESAQFVSAQAALARGRNKNTAY